MAELLGDVQGILDRVEALQAAIPKTVKEAKTELQAAVKEGNVHINEACVRLSRVIDQQTKDAVKATQAAAGEASAAARELRLARGRLTALLTVFALVGGGVGGAAVYLAMRMAGG
ncbi:hypothetical protein NY98_05405 [Xanthomonas citri pv. fuscans]|uniref:StbC n=2 Tax=Xanthomonas TaxID=338 RepID=A0AB34QGD2_XANCH|nr:MULTISPECIES: hypothetical protein [Xanthomonas]ATB60871.1 hypothetical protein CKU38_04570 [Xanthomonas citri pv. fuscans]ATS28463.1 hypothetical protein XppCFBP6164P_24105 [Xanthomonas phaseoli pv. phaseoli]ATS32461.1 hypothetical protein XppCFBP6546P_23375 [Xanthomonas phaseoli pv. phaseoli]ATS66061.1 hypothetical protein XcfCFBP4885P_22615 [Xanthomonas citri pv. phaseoli var. fuscans]ATS74264.1 hypothetical protein XcfCFBP6166P_22760 [Xanthomonas citri pv. phaseoli var. fuscans]